MGNINTKLVLDTLIVFLCILSICCQATVEKSPKKRILIKDNEYCINKVINLNGDTIELTRNSILKFKESGSIVNGVIIGDSTFISSSKQCFDNVKFEGSYKEEPKIEWFKIVYDKLYDNSKNLNSALHLAHLSERKSLKLKRNSKIYVKSHFENPGTENFLLKGTVNVESGVSFDLNQSTLLCIPNGARQYNILFARNAIDICIKNGNITGDLQNHLGQKGEWGYGIELQGVKNFNLEDLYISECYGDGINIQVSQDGDGKPNSKETLRGHCKNGTIKNCISARNRRQGMSIEGAFDLLIANCTFSNTSGAYPKSGVDIEPYSELNIVKNIIFFNCTFMSNENSGLFIKGRNVSDVKVDNCLFKDNRGYQITLCANNISILNCNKITKDFITIHMAGAKNVIIQGCKVSNILMKSLNELNVSNKLIFSKCQVNSYGKIHELVSKKTSSKNNHIEFQNCIIDGIFTEHRIITK